jgi:hypothetical protein
MCPRKQQTPYATPPTCGDIYTPAPYRKHSLLARSKSAPSNAFIKKWRYRSTPSSSSASTRAKHAQPQLVFPLTDHLPSPPPSSPDTNNSPSNSPVDDAEAFLLCWKKYTQKKKTTKTNTTPLISTYFSNTGDASCTGGEMRTNTAAERRNMCSTPHTFYDINKSDTQHILVEPPEHDDPLAYFRAFPNVQPMLPAPF